MRTPGVTVASRSVYDARVTAATPPAPLRSGGADLPVLGPLTPVGRTALIVTVVASIAAVILDFGVHADATLVFIVAAAAILGLAWVVGLSTERLGSLTGPQVGGILNATFGNIAELIIAFFALQAGLIEVVKASLTGSIIGNLLLVLGASVFIGGLRHGAQTFSQRIAVLECRAAGPGADRAVRPGRLRVHHERPDAGLADRGVGPRRDRPDGRLRPVARSTSSPTRTRRSAGTASPPATPGRPGRRGSRSASCSAQPLLLAVLSEILVSSIEPFIDSFGLSAFFVGVVLIPTIGNLAEHLVAVQLAAKDKMEFAMAVTFGSSLQVALFVAPVLVLLGVLLGQPMDLVFTPLEVAAVAAAVGISALIALDGESNWLEGALLMLVYADPGGLVLRVRLGRWRQRRRRREGDAPPPRAGVQPSGGGPSASGPASSSSSSVDGRVDRLRDRARSAAPRRARSAWATSESAACCAS